jgi:hypothetical protein
LQKDWEEEAYMDYAMKQFTIEQVSEKYERSEATIWIHFDSFEDKSSLKRVKR